MINFIEYGETTSGEQLYAKVDESGKITMTCTEIKKKNKIIQ